ncbi:hypothetical protein C0583_00950 [Candidatus Parcubacteria bacterium]|nr:MAG: hypothetical protein C0583_00950 [Candidatus Parcubacteria bacterium]
MKNLSHIWYNYVSYTSVMLVILLLLGGCSIFANEKDQDLSWKNDVLLAQECGEEGLMCCLEKDPLCKYGDCCFDPNNPENNICSQSCDYGTLDNFCREGNDCDASLSCYESFCVVCGGLEQPCCADETCSDGGTCFRGECVECGVTGNPCCEGEKKCFNQALENSDRAECIDEMCTLCGHDGNIKCQKEPFCNENHLQNNYMCLQCGGFNQPCCREIVAPGETRKYCLEEDLECKLDFCSK